MIRPFTYDALAGRVVFGVGARHELAAEADRLGARRCLLIASGRDDALVDELSAGLGAGRAVARFRDVVQHVPVDRAEAAVALADAESVDTVIAVGGGSAIGFGKIVALSREVMSIAVPTTYSGSEMTTVWGRTDAGHKRTGRDHRVKPDTVIYDPELTRTLPPEVAGPSGMNAMAHAVEALYGPGANPVIDVLALEAARALAAGLPQVTSGQSESDGRADVLYGAYLAGVVLATGGTALHHKTCHVLGGMFGLDHGRMNAVMLGHAVAHNAPAIGPQLDRLARSLTEAGRAVPGGEGVPGREGVAGALFDLAAEIGCPTSLAEIGMPAGGIGEAARRVVEEAAANVIPPTEAAVTAMLTAAHKGERPRPR